MSAAGTIFIKNLKIPMSIGIFEHEKTALQTVIISLEGDYILSNPLSDEIESAVCYDTLSKLIGKIASGRHFNLVETLAEEIAAACLAQDSRLTEIRVRIEKPDAIPEAESVGVRIARNRKN